MSRKLKKRFAGSDLVSLGVHTRVHMGVFAEPHFDWFRAILFWLGGVLRSASFPSLCQLGKPTGGKTTFLPFLPSTAIVKKGCLIHSVVDLACLN